MDITLPNEPIDNYEIKWFSVEGPHIRVTEWRLVYHAIKSWREVCPDAQGDGADFCDQWQVFENGRFESRLIEWKTPTTDRYWQEKFQIGYATKGEAIARARELVRARVGRLRDEVADLEARLNFGDLV